MLCAPPPTSHLHAQLPPLVSLALHAATTHVEKPAITSCVTHLPIPGHLCERQGRPASAWSSCPRLHTIRDSASFLGAGPGVRTRSSCPQRGCCPCTCRAIALGVVTNTRFPSDYRSLDTALAFERRLLVLVNEFGVHNSWAAAQILDWHRACVMIRPLACTTALCYDHQAHRTPPLGVALPVASEG